jgi:hypothetical protein
MTVDEMMLPAMRKEVSPEIYFSVSSPCEQFPFGEHIVVLQQFAMTNQ